MQERGRSDTGDARPDRIDVLPAAEAGEVGVPADGDATLSRAPDQAPDAAATAPDATAPPAPTVPEVTDADAAGPPAPESPVPPDEPAPRTNERDADDPGSELPGPDLSGDHLAVVPDFPGDDLLFDPLLSDEPIDLAAVRADDALIDALSGGDLHAAHDLIDADDPLIAMLAAWAASTRPDEEPEPERGRPPLTLVGAADEPDETEPVETQADETPAALVEVPLGSGDGPADPPVDEPAADEPAAYAPAATEPAADEPAAEVGAGAGALTPVAAVLRLVPPPVLGVLDRARRTRRRPTPDGRPLPARHPLRRAAVAVVVAALGVSGAAAAGGTAQPGEAGFAMTHVFFSERARSLEAAQVVADGLARAKVYLAQQQPALAAQELAEVQNRLPDVRDEEGHTLLVDQQQVLAAAVALTPPAPPDPRSTGPTTPGIDPDTSILAESAPPATVPDATIPGTKPDPADVVTAPSDDTVSEAAPTPDQGSAEPEGAGTAGTPPEVVTSTVSGATDQGTVTAEPTPTSDAAGNGGEDTTTVTATSAPTDPTTTTSATTEPTTSSSTSTPPSSTSPPADDEGTVATGSVPVDDSPIVVPAAHHEPMDDPVAIPDETEDTDASPPVVRAVVPEPVAHPAPVVTTVPRPIDDVTPADTVSNRTKSTDMGSKGTGSDARRDRHHAAAVAGARLSGLGEIRLRSGAGRGAFVRVSRGR